MTSPSYVVYQSNADYTVFIINYDDSFNKDPNSLRVGREGVTFDFRVQAVTGYFHGAPPFLDAVFEGEGSEWTEFSIKIPVTDKSGPTSTVTTVPLTPGGSSTSNPNNPPQQSPLQSNLITFFAFVCIIVILLMVIAYLLCKQRKNKTIQCIT